jgi:hypothetical protein
MDQYRTLFDKFRSVFADISADIFGITENWIFRCLSVFFPKREKNPCLSLAQKFEFGCRPLRSFISCS